MTSSNAVWSSSRFPGSRGGRRRAAVIVSGRPRHRAVHVGSTGGRGATKPRAVRAAAVLPHHVIRVRHAGAAHDAVDDRDARVTRGLTDARTDESDYCKRPSGRYRFPTNSASLMTGLFQSWLRRLVHTADAHRDRMWGVVARIAAAAVVVAAVQHHASQMYEAWRSEQQEGISSRRRSSRSAPTTWRRRAATELRAGTTRERERTEQEPTARTGRTRGFEAVWRSQDVLHVRGRGVVGVGGVATITGHLCRARFRSRRSRRRRAPPRPRPTPDRRSRGRARRRSWAPRGAAIREVEARVRARVRS